MYDVHTVASTVYYAHTQGGLPPERSALELPSISRPVVSRTHVRYYKPRWNGRCSHHTTSISDDLTQARQVPVTPVCSQPSSAADAWSPPDCWEAGHDVGAEPR